jgi:hypothetical protein
MRLPNSDLIWLLHFGAKGTVRIHAGQCIDAEELTKIQSKLDFPFLAIF